MTSAVVIAVAVAGGHGFSKPIVPRITLVAGIGVAGDAHAGVTVKHRSRVAVNPDQPNLRQVHLLHAEALNALAQKRFKLEPGDIGENVLTRGIALLGLPAGTRLQLGETAVVELTGLRNPCAQLDNFQRGLTKAMIDRGPASEIIRKAGVMAIVITGGQVSPGDPISINMPPEPHHPLVPV